MIDSRKADQSQQGARRHLPACLRLRNL